MRGALLIAWREYKQYVFSRGFLLLLFIAPIGLMSMAFMLNVIQKSIPVKHFVVVDKTNTYSETIKDYFDDLYDRQVISAWDQYLTIYSNPSTLQQASVDKAFLPATVTTQRIIDFKKAGGIRGAQNSLSSYLRANIPDFEVPARRYIMEASPIGIAPTGTIDEAIDLLRPYLLEGDKNARKDTAPLFAALFIPADFDSVIAGGENAQYWSRNLLDTELQDHFERALDRALQQNKAAAFGLDEGAYQSILSSIASIEVFRPDRATEDAALNIQDRIETALPAAMTYFLFVLIFSIGSLLLTNTIEERSNKIVEMLLSSVTANQLMLGKLIGIGAVGLTIPVVGLTIGVAASLTVFSGNEIVQQVVQSVLYSPLVWVYLFYFLCGYVIFAMIYLAIGAISNSIQDAQTFLGPVTLVVMAPLPLMFLVFQDPNGLAASILTWIPIYTPYAVMLRAASDPPLWEIIGATVFMLVFGGFFVMFMGRIFRRGLLNDSPPNIKGILKLATREKP